MRNENPLELVVKEVSNIDLQNLLISLLIREMDIGKKNVFNKFLAKAPNPKDIEVKSRLDALRNSRNNSGSNGGGSPSFPPLLLPPPPLPQPLQSPRNNLIPPPNPFNLALTFQTFQPRLRFLHRNFFPQKQNQIKER